MKTIFTRMALTMLVSLKTTRGMVKVNVIGQMAEFIMGTGRMTRGTVKEHSLLRTEKLYLVIGRTERYKINHIAFNNFITKTNLIALYLWLIQ